MATRSVAQYQLQESRKGHEPLMTESMGKFDADHFNTLYLIKYMSYCVNALHGEVCNQQLSKATCLVDVRA